MKASRSGRLLARVTSLVSDDRYEVSVAVVAGAYFETGVTASCPLQAPAPNVLQPENVVLLSCPVASGDPAAKRALKSKEASQQESVAAKPMIDGAAGGVIDELRGVSGCFRAVFGGARRYGMRGPLIGLELATSIEEAILNAKY